MRAPRIASLVPSATETLVALGLGDCLVARTGDVYKRQEQGRDLRALTAAEVAHPRPRTVGAEALAVDAADLMEAARITVVLVVDAEQRLLGAISINDLMRAKVI